MASSLIALAVDPSNPVRQEWGTPWSLFLPLHEEYEFTLDACANYQNSKLKRFFSPEENGLVKSWKGERVWCNPPFNEVGKWVEKAYKEMMENGVFSVLLVPARTDSEWFYRYSRFAEVHFFRRRVAYDPPAGVKASSPSFASMLLVFGLHTRFSHCFRDAKTGAYLG